MNNNSGPILGEDHILQRDAAVTALLESLWSLASKLDLNPEYICDEIRRIAAQEKPSETPATDKVHVFDTMTIQPLSEILAEWYDNSRFVDAWGEPIPLPSQGEVSIATLLSIVNEKTKTDLTVERVIELLTVANCITKLENGEWVATRYGFPVNAQSAAATLTHLDKLAGFALTVAHNDENPDDDRPLFVAHNERCAASQKGLVAGMTKEVALNVLRDIYAQMKSVEDDESTINVSVGVYFAMNDRVDELVRERRSMNGKNRTG